MNKFLAPGILALLISSGGCKNAQPVTKTDSSDKSTQNTEVVVAIDSAHNSQNALDWPGQYKGTVPCADCEGIEVSLAIQEDGAYYRTFNYLGKSTEPVFERGKFQWSAAGNHIRLQLPNSLVQWYQVGEDVLYHLDINGKRIEGDLADNYILRKEPGDAKLENKQWRLMELNGRSVEGSGAMRNPHLSLDGVRKRVSGNDGCNSYTGTYELKSKGAIKFGPLASTEMFCEGDTISNSYYQALEKVENYQVKGTELIFAAEQVDLLRFSLSVEE